MEELANLGSTKGVHADKLRKDVRGLAGALLNGLLVQSDWTSDEYLKRLSMELLEGRPDLPAVIERALRFFPAKMPAFLHYVDGFLGNEVVDDLAYFNIKNHKHLTIRNILTGYSSADAEEYRRAIEEFNRTHRNKGQRLEPVPEAARMYAWLRSHFLHPDLIKSHERRARHAIVNADKAMAGAAPVRGGIDLTSDKALSVKMDSPVGQNDNAPIQFYLDPAQLAQWQAAPGVIFNIVTLQPMPNIRLWLGITDR